MGLNCSQNQPNVKKCCSMGDSMDPKCSTLFNIAILGIVIGGEQFDYS